MNDPVFSLRGPTLTYLIVALVLFAVTADRTAAQASSVVNTVHNLSVSGPGEIKSLTETEVCKFCHIPHNTVAPKPLWGHTMPSTRLYAVPVMRTEGGAFSSAPQPDGSSRLCLSCHDGTVALGDVAGEQQPIQMAGSQRLRPGHRGYLGTDLSGSHPVSFVVPSVDPGLEANRDMGLKPLSVIRADSEVRLDDHGKMQCTSCHDPHKDEYFVPNRVPRFWVKPTTEAVCLTCHELR